MWMRGGRVICGQGEHAKATLTQWRPAPQSQAQSLGTRFLFTLAIHRTPANSNHEAR